MVFISLSIQYVGISSTYELIITVKNLRYIKKKINNIVEHFFKKNNKFVRIFIYAYLYFM